MPVYKVTIGFVNFVYGPSESYWTKEGTTDAQVGPLVTRLLAARQKLLSVGTMFTGVRIGLAPEANTNLPAPRRSNMYPPDIYEVKTDGIDLYVPERGLIPLTVDDDPVFNNKQTNDQTKACLQVRVRFAGDRRSNRYFAFPPDDMLYAEPNSFLVRGDPEWYKDYQAFEALLKADGWQIRARSRDPGYVEQEIKSWYQAEAEASPMAAILPASPPPGIAYGDWVMIKGVRRKGTDKLSYNGRYHVSEVNPTFKDGKVAIYLEHTEGGEVDSIKLPGTIQKIAFRYYPIDFFSPLRATTHKRGRPFGSPVGRRKSRVSLDP